jgi:glycosyltransferase involved in cell wall biosynthesis
VRLGLLIYGSLETVSGGFLYDRNLVRYLRRQGDRVEVISLPWRSYPRGLWDNFSRQLWRRLREASWDVLLQDELAHPSLCWLNRRLRSRVAYPILAIVHHLRSREDHPGWLLPLYRAVERRYLTSVDGFICVSRTTRIDVTNLVGPTRPAVVAYPGGNGLPGGATPEEIQTRAGAPGPLRVIFVGNLIPRKELHTLLDALARLPREDWLLTVAGSLTADEAYAAAIRRRIDAAGLTENVTLLGTLSREQLAAQLAASHLLAVPSSYEGFGIVYLEGMHFGLPAIAGTRGAAREIITPGQDGLLVTPGDADALARSIASLLRDRERLLRMSLAARQRAAAHPTWEESAARVRDFLTRFA